MPITSVAAGSYAAAQRLSALEKQVQAASKPQEEFASLVKESLQSVSQSAAAADRSMASAMKGGTDLLDVVTAVAESETAVQTLVSVRDRVIAAYEDVMRMAI